MKRRKLPNHLVKRTCASFAGWSAYRKLRPSQFHELE
jgi:hypothetical protein